MDQFSSWPVSDTILYRLSILIRESGREDYVFKDGLKLMDSLLKSTPQKENFPACCWNQL